MIARYILHLLHERYIRAKAFYRENKEPLIGFSWLFGTLFLALAFAACTMHQVPDGNWKHVGDSLFWKDGDQVMKTEFYVTNEAWIFGYASVGVLITGAVWFFHSDITDAGYRLKLHIKTKVTGWKRHYQDWLKEGAKI